MGSSHNFQEDNEPGPASLRAVTSWGAELSLSDVTEQDESTMPRRAGSIEGTTDTGPCIVYDGGDKAQLKTTGRHGNEQPSQQQRSSAPTQAHLVSHAGDLFQESTELLDRSSALEINPHADGNDDKFDDLVFKSFHNRNDKDNRFLPFDKLDQIVTKERINTELRSYFPSWFDSQVEACTAQIWGTSSLPVRRQNSDGKRSRTHTDQTTRRKLFTILAYMKKLDLIPCFIKSEIYDRHLPFTFRYDDEGAASVTFTIEDITSSTEVFKGWGHSGLEQFDTFQWRLLSPFFSFGPTPHHYLLPSPTILPFNKKRGRESAGGFGEVRKMKIHRAHYHDSISETRPSRATDTESPPLACKKLFSHDKDAFGRELMNHQNMPPHPSLIRLLASYEWKGDYYLILPWADGNLLDFWKEKPRPARLKQDPALILWLSEQCLNLMEGLNAIHNAGSFFTDSSRPQGTKAHGRHGDLKPHNILWFKEDMEGESSLGTFKYCDFGVSAFHNTKSLQESHDKYARSLTYMAPESETGYKIDLRYDIFSLGCILLEFVTWYLGGWEAVQKFADCRCHKEEGNSSKSIQKDSFYNYFPSYTHTNGRASLKRDVQKQFDHLEDHPLCVDYLIELLDLIQESMIRMTPGNRAGVQYLVSQLQTLDRRCREDTSFATKKTKVRLQRKGTDLSSLPGCTTRKSTDPMREIAADRSTFPNSIAHEQERQKRPSSKAAVLREEPTQTEGLDRDAVDRGRSKESPLLPGSLDPPTTTSQGEGCRSEDVKGAGGSFPAVVDQEPDLESEPLLSLPFQEVESPTALGDVR